MSNVLFFISCQFLVISVNLAIFDNISLQIRVDAAETPQQKPPTGKPKNSDKRVSTQMPSLRD